MRVSDLFSFRITRDELRALEKSVNSALENCGTHVRIKLNRRYNYWAIDFTDEKGVEKDTVISGLSASEAQSVLMSLRRVLNEVCFRR